MNLNDDLSLAAHRPCWQDCQLLKRFRDILLKPLPMTTLSYLNPPPILSPTPSIHSFASHVGQLFQTPHNVFGLFRQYCSDKPPSHDPKEHIDLSNLSNFATGTSHTSQSHILEADFYPFPNKSSFLLGKWYWNDGVKKSQESFHALLSIIGHPDFHSEDVQHTKWSKIDALLAKNDFDSNGIKNENVAVGDDEDAEWMDNDAGWGKKPYLYLSSLSSSHEVLRHQEISFR
jgi:hypothetical protein